MKAVEQPPWGEFASLEAFSSVRLRDGRFCVTLSGGRFEAWLHRQPGRHLWVLLSAARNPGRSRLPKFDRWSWASMFPGPVLCISDPTLYLDTQRLRIGWYVGTASEDWQAALADLVRSLARRLGFETHQVIAYGSSAGGFGSLMLAARLGDATAVAINPQSDVLRYAPAAVTRLLDLAFDGRSADELTDDERLRLSAVRRYAVSPSVRCLYVQNRLDTTHFVHHFAPFARESFMPLDGGADHSGHLHAMLYDDERGHAPEPPEMLPALIARACQLADTRPAPRPLGTPPLSIDHTPLARAFTLRQIGLGRTRKGRTQSTPAGIADSPLDMDTQWRFLDETLATLADKGLADTQAAHIDAIGAIDAWIDAAVAGHLPSTVWDPPAPAQRALRLAMLLSLHRAGWPLWPEARHHMLDAAFDGHLRHLLNRAADAAHSPTPMELQATAALAQHVRGAPISHWIQGQWQWAVDLALQSRFSGDGMVITQTPAHLAAAIRQWKNCVASRWFDETALPARLASAHEMQQWLRWPDGRALPLGLAAASASTVPSGPCVFEARNELRAIGGHVISRDDAGGRVERASLLHLMAAHRTPEMLHDDALSVLWFEGAEVLTDPGQVSGVGPTLSNYFKRSAAHNTVAHSNGRGTMPRTVRSEVLDTQAIADRMHISARRTDADASWKHVRHVVHAPGAWLLLVDMLDSRDASTWSRWLHFGSAVQPADDRGVAWRLPDGRTLTVHTDATTAWTSTRIHGQTAPEAQGWLATDQGVVPGWAVSHVVTGARCVLATWLVLDDEGSTLTMDGDKALRLRLAGDGVASALRLGWTVRRCRFDAASLGLK